MFACGVDWEESLSSADCIHNAALCLSRVSAEARATPPLPPTPFSSPISFFHFDSVVDSSIPAPSPASALRPPYAFPMLRVQVEVSEPVSAGRPAEVASAMSVRPPSYISHVATFGVRVHISRDKQLPPCTVRRSALDALRVASAATNVADLSLHAAQSSARPLAKRALPLALTLDVRGERGGDMQQCTTRTAPGQSSRDVVSMRAGRTYQCQVSLSSPHVVPAFACLSVVSVLLMHGPQLDYVEHLHLWTAIPAHLLSPARTAKDPDREASSSRRSRKKKRKREHQHKRERERSVEPSNARRVVDNGHERAAPSPSSSSPPAELDPFTPCCACSYRSTCRRRNCRCCAAGRGCGTCASDFCENDPVSRPGLRHTIVSRALIKEIQREQKRADAEHPRTSRSDREDRVEQACA